MAQDLLQQKELHPLLSCQRFPTPRAKTHELRVAASAWRNLLSLAIEAKTSSITPPFQIATNLCTEIRSLEPQHSSDLSLLDFSTARNKKNQKPSRTTLS